MDNVMKELMKSSLIDTIKKGKRLSQTEPYEYREIEVKPNVLKTSEGSAYARIGDTQVLASIKFAIGEPYSDRPNEGVFMTNAEFVPFANKKFEPGPPNEDAIELARVVDRGIRSSEIVDVKSFCLEDGKVLMMFIDLWILDDQGNLTDASALAAMTALLNTKIPEYKDGVLIREGKLKNMKIKEPVTAHTFCKILDKTILDPILDEEIATQGKITFGVMGDKIVSVQKNGGAPFTKEEIFELMDIAFKKHSEHKKILQNAK